MLKGASIQDVLVVATSLTSYKVAETIQEGKLFMENYSWIYGNPASLFQGL